MFILVTIQRNNHVLVKSVKLPCDEVSLMSKIQRKQTYKHSSEIVSIQNCSLKTKTLSVSTSSYSQQNKHSYTGALSYLVRLEPLESHLESTLFSCTISRQN